MKIIKWIVDFLFTQDKQLSQIALLLFLTVSLIGRWAGGETENLFVLMMLALLFIAGYVVLFFSFKKAREAKKKLAIQEKSDASSL